MAAAGTTAHHRCALAGWAVSLVVSTFWIRFVVGCPVWPDVACGFVSHLIALSVLWLEPRLMIPIGLALMGVCVGLMLVDMAFDLVIIREGSVRLGPTTVTPGRLVAHHYYHSMLNATHINMAMWTAMLVLVLAAARGLEAARGTSQSSSTNCVYMYCVIPRYLAIRDAQAYDASAFDRWGEVLAARAVLLASICYAAAQCMRLTLKQSVETPQKRE